MCFKRSAYSTFYIHGVTSVIQKAKTLNADNVRDNFEITGDVQQQLRKGVVRIIMPASRGPPVAGIISHIALGSKSNIFGSAINLLASKIRKSKILPLNILHPK